MSVLTPELIQFLMSDSNALYTWATPSAAIHHHHIDAIRKGKYPR